MSDGGINMERINGLTNALAEFITDYCDTHDLTFNEAMNALSHLFVIYGFALKAEGVSDDAMEVSLKHCIEQDIKAMRGLLNAQEA
jgi:hypothetical protein